MLAFTLIDVKFPSSTAISRQVLKIFNLQIADVV